jgi:hypothetical protein
MTDFLKILSRSLFFYCTVKVVLIKCLQSVTIIAEILQNERWQAVCWGTVILWSFLHCGIIVSWNESPVNVADLFSSMKQNKSYDENGNAVHQNYRLESTNINDRKSKQRRMKVCRPLYWHNNETTINMNEILVTEILILSCRRMEGGKSWLWSFNHIF